MADKYKTVCDKCGRLTWYETEQQCHCSYFPSETCTTCGHTETDYDNGQVRCTGTLRLLSDVGMKNSD